MRWKVWRGRRISMSRSMPSGFTRPSISGRVRSYSQQASVSLRSGIRTFRQRAAKAWTLPTPDSRFGRGRRWQPTKAGTLFEIEQQAERQGREHGRGGDAGGIKQVGDPMIADVEEMEGAIGAKEQTHPIEAAPELLRHDAALAAGERGAKHVCQPGKARIAYIYPHEVGIGEHRARIAIDTDHLQHGRIAGAKQRAHGQRHRHRLRRRDLAIEALVAPADFKSVKVRKPCREVPERAQAAPARLIRKRGARNDDAGMVAMTDH